MNEKKFIDYFSDLILTNLKRIKEKHEQIGIKQIPIGAN